MENREKMEETSCEIICGAPTTLAVKGLMMMMMMTLKACHRCRDCDQLSSGLDADLKCVKVGYYMIIIIYYFMFTNNSCLFK